MRSKRGKMIRDEKACLRWKYSRGLEALGLFQKSYSTHWCHWVHPLAFMVQKSVCECVLFVCIYAFSGAAMHLLCSSSLWLMQSFVERFCWHKTRLYHYEGPPSPLPFGVWWINSTGCIGWPWTAPALPGDWLTVSGYAENPFPVICFGPQPLALPL